MAAAVMNSATPEGMATNGHVASEANKTQDQPIVTGDVDTIINYFDPPPEPLPHCDYTNVEILTGNRYSDPKPVHLKDVKIHDPENKFNMDNNGFVYVKHKSEHLGIDFTDDDQVKSTHYEECAELVKKVTGAKTAFSFQHVYRHDVPKEMSITRGKQAKSPPLGRAHIDLSVDGAKTRLGIYLNGTDQDVTDAWNKGVMMISVWRPLLKVFRDPLSVMDTQTLPDDDMVPFANPLKLPDRVERLERLTIKHNPNHQWYWMSEQTPDDVLFVKFVDSRPGQTRQTGCPHSAVVIPGTEECEARASLETRVMAFF